MSNSSLDVKSQPANSGTAGAQAIRRAIDVIRVVAQIQRAGATLSRVANSTGLSRSTAFRILRSLTEERMLRYEEAEHHYYLGPLAFEFGLATQSEAQIHSSWRESVERVAQQTRLTTYLMARSDNEAVCLLCTQGSSVIRAIPMDVGQRLPLGIGAGSLAILSTLEDEEVRCIVASHGARLDLFPGGRLQPRQILERVAATKQNGFSISSGSVAAGLTGIGVAVPARRGLMQIAISVSAVADTIELVKARQIASVITTAINIIRS